jgi:hypothetical protein
LTVIPAESKLLKRVGWGGACFILYNTDSRKPFATLVET